jgi:hypothetical protein
MKHHVERTSPKGYGMQFIGTCRLCGKSGLNASAALEDCENVRGLSAEEAMIETIMGPDASPHRGDTETDEEYANRMRNYLNSNDIHSEE